MIYQWKVPGLYSISAQEAGVEIESSKNGDGFITQEAVVEKAKDESSAIHGCFEWDDDTAAVQYRLHQAGELIRNIVTVKIEVIDQPATPVRAFVNIKSEAGRGYKSISAVVHNCGEYEYMLTCAKNELEAFSRKYATLGELSGVLAAIREALE